MTRTFRKSARLAAAVVASGLLTAGCAETDGAGGRGSLSGTIRIDGSSTVGPLSEAAAELFREEESGVQITVGTSGTGGGFKKFCAGETDISDASRPIASSEEQLCQQNGVRYDQFQVANDGIAVVVNPDNNWAECLTVEHLRRIWDQGSTVDNWRDVDPRFPDERLQLFGAGTDSGTFDFFTQAVNGKEKQSRTDYNATEDDNVTVQGVSGTKGGLGYFGLSYYEQNKESVKVVKVDGGGGCVEPSTQTVQNGTYKPLSRPLFIYPSGRALARPEVVAFLEFYVANSDDIATQALFVPLTASQKDTLRQKLDALKQGADTPG
ncbi:MAG TPA: PstS family phosphate ABC transporter substrate-binding protein [Acidimicrobiales bacterium]|nr:PstS family phosphate ABC transporter substrate-binding protein [Acidimicrobiales bacterium]